MKIVVAVKQVPERDAAVRLVEDGRRVEAKDDQSWTMNEPDAYALEEALRLKEAAGGTGEVVVVCAGPERVTSTLREALAKGADRAVHVEVADLGAYDALAVAEMLAQAVQEEAPDLLLTGLQSDDLGMGQTGVVVAELLGMVHATIVTGVEMVGGGLRVTRELEDGWSQMAEMPVPAVLTIQSGRNRPRYATLMGIKRAKSKELRTVRPEAVGAEMEGAKAERKEACVVLERVSLPVREKRTAMLTGSAEEVAAALVERLRFEIGVL